MPRKARVISENGIYYVYTRSDEHSVLCSTPEDFQTFLNILKNVKSEIPFALYAFSITKCEFHMIFKELNAGNISEIMKRICFAYTKYKQKNHGHTGKIFKDRFKSSPAPLDNTFLPLIRYIHQTPSRTKEHMNISSYPFSSYPLYFQEKSFLDDEGILNYFAPTREEALQKMKIFHAPFEFEQLKPKERCTISRTEVAELIEKITKNTPKDIKAMEKSKRNILIKRIKSNSNLSIRQIAFALSLSRNTISQVLKQKTLIL